MKHATVSFGQSLSADILQESKVRARQAELFFAIGCDDERPGITR